MATSWDDHLNDTYEASYQVGPNYDAGYSSGGGGFGGGDYPERWPSESYDRYYAPGSSYMDTANPMPMPGYEHHQFEDGSERWGIYGTPDSGIPWPESNPYAEPGIAIDPDYRHYPSLIPEYYPEY